jgi:hypothetical protein
LSWCNTGCNLEEGNENATGLTTPTTALAISPKPARNPKFPNNTNTHTPPSPPTSTILFFSKTQRPYHKLPNKLRRYSTAISSATNVNPLPHSLKNPESATKCKANQSLERERERERERGHRNLCVVAEGSVLSFSSEQGHMGNGSLFYCSHDILLLIGAVNSGIQVECYFCGWL